MSFVNPSYLWALLGLLIPIVIHLWSKKEAKTIKIGSIQFLSESTSKQSSSVKLNELLLLMLRLLIIALITFILAKPQWNGKKKNIPITYLVAPQLLEDEKVMKQFNSLLEDQQVRLFKKGFPFRENAKDYVDKDEVLDYWELASETNQLQTDSIVIFVRGYIRGIRGARPETNHRIKWVVVEDVQTKKEPLIAYQAQDDIKLFSAVSTINRLEVERKSITPGIEFEMSAKGDSLIRRIGKSTSGVSLIHVKPIEITLFYADSLENDKRFLEAAFETSAKYLNREIRVKSNLDTVQVNIAQPDMTIWLSNKPVPMLKGKVLFFEKDVLASNLIEEGVKNNTYRLTKQINTENAIQERLTERLLRLLELDKELKARLAITDMRQVNEKDLQTIFKPSNAKKTQLASITIIPYLWALLLALLFIERLVAYLRRQ